MLSLELKQCDNGLLNKASPQVCCVRESLQQAERFGRHVCNLPPALLQP